MSTALWVCLLAVTGLAAVDGQQVYPNTALRQVSANGGGQCVVEQHAVYYNTSIEVVQTINRTDQVTDCCNKCFEHANKASQTGQKPCNLWTWCDRLAGKTCTLPADVTDPPSWTVMAPGQCVLQYLRLAEPGFSNSPRLSGERQRNSTDLNYWTGGTLPPSFLFDVATLPPSYHVFKGIELTLAYDWIGCPSDPPYGPVALGNTSASYCWRKGTAADLVYYCSKHKECDALVLFYNGFSLSPKWPHCWASAFFKTGGGNLSLATQLTLSPQATLYVKKSAWTPAASDIASPRSSEFSGSVNVAVVTSYSTATNWTCTFNDTSGDSIQETYDEDGSLLAMLKKQPTRANPSRGNACLRAVECPDYTCAPSAKLFEVNNTTFIAFGEPRKKGVGPDGRGIYQTPGDCCDKCRNTPECKHWVSCSSVGGCGAGCGDLVRTVGANVSQQCWDSGRNWPTGSCMLLREPPSGQLGVLQAGPNTLFTSGTPYTIMGGGHTMSGGSIAGTVVGAVVLMALGIAGIIAFRRYRRTRPKYVFDEPDSGETTHKKSASGTNGTSGTGTSGSAISAELRKAAFHIDPKDIVIEQNENGNVMLGKGAFGEVYAASWFQTKVAVKYLTKEDGEAEKEFLNEIQMMSQCFHQNIVTFYSACMEPRRYMLVYEFMAAGDLNKALACDHADPRRLGWYGLGLKILLDVARGLAFLHSKRVIHYDIKSSNILLDTLSKHVTAKIADVGLSRIMRATMATMTDGHFMRGTESYMAPELFEYGGPRPTTAVDMFSYGVLMWEVVTGERPWMVRGGVTGDFKVPDEAPQEVADLIQRLISHDAAARPTALDVIDVIEPLQPNFTRNGSLPLSAGTSLPGSLPSVDSRGNPQPWASHRRNVSS